MCIITKFHECKPLPSTTLGSLKLSSLSAVKNWSAGANYFVSEGLSVRAEINFPKLFAKIVATEEKQIGVLYYSFIFEVHKFHARCM